MKHLYLNLKRFDVPVEYAGDGGDQLVHVDAVGVLNVPAQAVDLPDDILGLRSPGVLPAHHGHHPDGERAR